MRKVVLHRVRVEIFSKSPPLCQIFSLLCRFLALFFASHGKMALASRGAILESSNCHLLTIFFGFKQKWTDNFLSISHSFTDFWPLSRCYPRFWLLATFIIFLCKNGPIHFAYFLIKCSLEPYKQYKKSPLAKCLHFGSYGENTLKFGVKLDFFRHIATFKFCGPAQAKLTVGIGPNLVKIFFG